MSSFLFSLLVITGAAYANADQSLDGIAVKATVCEALSQPLRYNGQIVQITGRLEGTDEGSWFIGDDCPGVMVTNRDHVWPSTIFLVSPSATIQGQTRIHALTFGFDLDSERRQNFKYKDLRRRIADRCLEWVYTGLFETRTDWSKAEFRYANGASRVIGFGHLGEAPAQLILKSADDVLEIPRCDNKAPKKR